VIVRRARLTGAALALERDVSGRFNVDALPVADVDASIELSNCFVAYADRALGTRIVIDKIDGDARYRSGRVSFGGRFFVNGGRGRIEGEGDLAEMPPRVRIETLAIDGADVSEDLAPIAPLIPLFGRRPEVLSGTFDLSIRDLVKAGDALTGEGTASLRDGTIRAQPIIALAEALHVSMTGAQAGDALPFDGLRSTFEIAKGDVHARLVLDTARTDLALVGTTYLDGALDYVVECDEGRGSSRARYHLGGTLARPTLEPMRVTPAG
jgi:hypothetical protein